MNIFLKEAIEKNDLNNFKKLLKKNNIKEKVAFIENYSVSSKGSLVVSSHTSMDNCDSLKYAIHNNADSIVNYLFSNFDINVNSYGDDYGWPILLMALKNKRYDYALKIIEHPTFEYLTRPHLNSFKVHSIKETEYLSFMIAYFKKIEPSALIYDNFIKHCVFSLLKTDEKTYSLMNDIFLKACQGSNFEFNNIWEIYTQYSINLISTEVFNQQYIHFLAEKLNIKTINEVLDSFINDQYSILGFLSAPDHDVKNGLSILLKCPFKLKKLFDDNNVLFSSLTLENILYLEKNNISIWTEDDNNNQGVDYIVFTSSVDVNDKKIVYLIDNNLEKIKIRLNQLTTEGGYFPALNSYLMQKDLDYFLVTKSSNQVMQKI